MNPNKTSTNFTIGEDGSVRLDEESEYIHHCYCSFLLFPFHVVSVSEQWMPWCGLLINTRTLEVRSDYSRYTKKSESISVSYSAIQS